jgi:transposase-like protein
VTKSKKADSGAGSAGEVKAPPRKRRVFTAQEKLRIVREAEQCAPGELGALLRKEGIYSSHLSTWRRALGVHGSEGLGQVKRGRKTKHDAKDRHIEQLEKRLRAAERELAIRQALIELQKKVSVLLGVTLPTQEEP